jgi:tetratricopeptide (TPR) repeat protein
MLGEFYSRQGKYEDALNCHERLKRVYDVHKHSALVVEAYASDRSAQNYGNGANCLFRLGRVEESLELTSNIVENLMPHMDLKNVHNSMIMIYPLIWILKSAKEYRKVLSMLERFVFEPFDEYFGKDGRTFTTDLFKPLKALFNTLLFMEGEAELVEDNLKQWALDPLPFTFSTTLDNSMASFARCGSSIGAEVCLLLSKIEDDLEIKKMLIENGWKLAQTAMETAQSCGIHQTCYFEITPVYEELKILMESMDSIDRDVLSCECC